MTDIKQVICWNCRASLNGEHGGDKMIRLCQGCFKFVVIEPDTTTRPATEEEVDSVKQTPFWPDLLGRIVWGENSLWIEKVLNECSNRKS